MQEQLQDQPSQVQVLQTLDDDYKGWTTTNEDHKLLVESLKGIHRPGGMFLVGEFQAVDSALTIGADVIVLGDRDARAVEKNLRAMQIVEQANNVEVIYPKLQQLVLELDGEDSLKEFKKRVESAADTGSRIPLHWAFDENAFRKLKEMIQHGKVAVAQVDITDPETMRVVGDFFEKNDTRMETAYLSNTISFADFDAETRDEHLGAAEALSVAGGHEDTVLIRSRATIDSQILQKIFDSIGRPIPNDMVEQITEENRVATELHYGHRTKLILEKIERALTGSMKQAGFEFFTQSLNDYQMHVSEM